MKQRTKVMLSSLAAIAMSASLAVGATYALFTSETQVDISVSSGSVNVDATAKNLELYSRGLKQENGTFEVGGTATLVDNVITIERMVPMDSVKFDIVIENYSDVSVQYRTIVKEMEDTGLFSGLNVSFTGRKTNKAKFEGASSYSDWALVAPQDTNPATAEHIQTVGVTIELPEKAGNEYQNKSCKLVVIVEAVQANADVHSGVAKVGDKSYATLEEALKVAQPDDVVEMLHPGVYAPFTIDTEGVTVKGIVGENKLESTVFQVTGDNMINLMASGATIDGLWVEVMDGSTDWRAGAFNIVQSWDTGAVSDDVTITNSKIYGNDKLNFVLLCCNDTFTFTNNYVDGFPTAVSSMCDNSVAVLYTITGNTTNNVDSLLDGYWGMATTTGNPNIVVNNNVANDETLIRLWDYTYVKGVATSINAEVKGNTNATLKLTRKDNQAIVDTDETDVIYQNIVTLSNFADGTYTVTDENGNEPAMDDSKTVEVKNGTGTIVVSVGNYKLENANYLYKFAVEQNTFAVNQEKVEYGASNNAQLLTAMKNGSGDIELSAGEYQMPDGSESLSLQGKTLTVKGTKDTVIDVSNVDERDQFVTGATLTFEGVTLNFGTALYMGFANTTSLLYKDCVINGVQHLYGQNITFEGCTLNVEGDHYMVRTWGGKNVTFNDCTFNCDGKAILVYNQSCNLTVNNCKFNDNGTIADKAAIEVCNGDNGPNCVTHNIVINNTTVNGFDINPNGINTGTALWANKNSLDAEHLFVTIDGKVASNGALWKAIENGETTIAFVPGTYQLPENDTHWRATRLAANTKFIGGKGVEIKPVQKASGKDEQGRIIADNYTFENITFTNTVSPSGYGKFVNCVFNGENGLRHGAYKNGNTTFTNCVFNNVDGWAFHTEYIYGVKVAFEGCTFNGAVEFTDTIETADNVYFNNCTFAGSNKLASGKIFYAWKNNAVLKGCIGYDANKFAGCTVS